MFEYKSHLDLLIGNNPVIETSQQICATDWIFKFQYANRLFPV